MALKNPGKTAWYGSSKATFWVALVFSFIVVVGVTALYYNRLQATGQYSEVSYVDFIANYSLDLVSIIVLWLLLSGLMVVSLIYSKSRKPLLYVNCFLIALVFATNIFVADKFSTLPNGPPSTYQAMDCGRHVAQSGAWPSSLPKEGFACTATKQAYGWPFIVSTVYTNVKDGFTNAPLNNFEIPGRQNIHTRHFNRLNSFAILGVQLVFFILFLLITSLPLNIINTFNAWRKRHEGTTTLMVATGAVIVCLLVGLVGLYST